MLLLLPSIYSVHSYLFSLGGWWMLPFLPSLHARSRACIVQLDDNSSTTIDIISNCPQRNWWIMQRAIWISTALPAPLADLAFGYPQNSKGRKSFEAWNVEWTIPVVLSVIYKLLVFFSSGNYIFSPSNIAKQLYLSRMFNLIKINLLTI